MSKQILEHNIINLSVHNSWDAAVGEWDFTSAHFAQEPQTCLCGHSPILEICTITNHVTGVTAEVGNCCVNNFMGLDSKPVFESARRIRKDIESSISPEFASFAHDQGWINDWEHNFILSNYRKQKRTRSLKQMAKRVQINGKILDRMQSHH